MRKGEFGKIYYFEGDYLYGRLNKLLNGWRGKDKKYSVMLGGGIHMIDLMVLFLGNFPVEVISSGNKIVTKNTKYNNDDFVISNFKFKNGARQKYQQILVVFIIINTLLKFLEQKKHLFMMMKELEFSIKETLIIQNF